jgi:hypothetical protein
MVSILSYHLVIILNQSFMVMVTSIGKINRIAGRHIFCQVAHHHHPLGLAERLPSAVFRKFETNC